MKKILKNEKFSLFFLQFLFRDLLLNNSRDEFEKMKMKMFDENFIFFTLYTLQHPDNHTNFFEKNHFSPLKIRLPPRCLLNMKIFV